MAEVKRLIKAGTPERFTQAKRDAEHEDQPRHTVSQHSAAATDGVE
jgi:hypothetical protein